MNPRALEIMREALEKISSIQKPTKDPVENYDPEELLEKLDFAVITARNALDRAVMLRRATFCRCNGGGLAPD